MECKNICNSHLTQTKLRHNCKQDKIEVCAYCWDKNTCDQTSADLSTFTLSFFLFFT